ncbi:MAG: UDP-N-acetylglucosamine 1-carboxyvinyltransferase [Eubacterium sp.]|uniref:UDP-N-acetylglucosamine 1-carboxyvinyltransferase n=1 Tax=Eubacterium sp. F2 TaxID=3381348 RepID=UPI0039080135|nr:UDP-N-acetylglucosamine 1-carboxyvinyltransferase [Eubacterium sp.]MCI2198077.1 UDP-N-acetylglucosamine 1-carboxyvinyltransferase [Eubacterium sp.]
MAKFLVQKSDPLHGEVNISGAKNAVLPLMAAAILPEDVCTISDVPELRDVRVMKEILSSLGLRLSEIDKNVLEIDASGLNNYIANYELVRKMRASFLVMGPLLARTGKARVHLPGGCTIGARPIDLHLKGFKALGAEVVLKDNYVETTAPAGGLIGNSIYLDFPSVGATENIMMAAVLAKGSTYIINAAEEPEIVDLANFLNKMGARVKGAGTDQIKIEGVEKLHGASHTVIPDRIEAGTYMLAAAITRGEVLVHNVVPDHIRPITAKLRECGVDVEIGDDGMFVAGDRRELTSTDIKTLPYPGFPTDIQSPFMAFLTTVKGSSTVIETVFENRFMHVAELNRMGANIKIDGNRAKIQGAKKLEGAQVIATDLRAGAALAIAGLVAEGTTEISEIYHIERGYAHFIEKFRGLGANILKIDD